MIPGYANAILYIDLTNKKIKKVPLDRSVMELYLGGRGIGAKLLYDLTKDTPKFDPLSPSNPLIIATGPFTGVFVPKANKYAYITKSPLTGAYLDTFSGGHFGPELKYAGYDVIVFTGASKNPVYLYINDDEVKIKNADHLWGKPVNEVDAILKKDYNDYDLKVAAIGPAGENLVRFACISNDLYRQAARGGAGAVWGSKKLKAIAVRGTKEIKIHNPKEFYELANEAFEQTKKSKGTELLYKHTTLLQTNDSKEWGVLPTKNYQTAYFNDEYQLNSIFMIEQGIKFKNRSCFACPIACSGYNVIKTGPFAGLAVEGPEYESATLLGSNCGVKEFEYVLKANELCDFYGMDTISTGGTVAFAMELYERGIITKNDTDGIELKFGNGEALVEIIKKIAFREGFGNILAEGSRMAAQKIGHGADRYAVHVKGMELPAYDPRGAIGMGLAYAINDVGGGHGRAWEMYAEIFNPKYDRYGTEGKAELYIDSQRRRNGCDILGFCRFVLLDYSLYAKILNALTGFNHTKESIYEVTDRVYTLTRLFNLREGLGRKDDTLPPRITEDPVQSGPTKGQKIPLEKLNKMIDDYYKLRGWDENGIPLPETLEQFKMSEYLDELKKIRANH